MKHYEIVFLVHPDHSDQVSAMIKRCVSTVKSAGGKIHRTEDWKRRQLAYPIAKVHKAHYVLMNIECAYSVVEQLTEFFRFNEAVLRNLVLRVNRAITELSPIKSGYQQEEETALPAEEAIEEKEIEEVVKEDEPEAAKPA